MDWIQFQHSERASLFFVLLALVLWMIWRIAVRSDKLGAFVSKAMQVRLVTRPTLGVQVLQVVCLAVSGILFIFALMQPQVVRQERVVLGKDSANIYVALDVSKSMLATDVAPDRLGRAKSEIRDMLPAFSSHRVGLLAFAGRTTVLSPLTMDHGFFRLALDSASPWSVTLGGTNLGEVIRKATKLLGEQEGPKALILITDGEDQDTYPLEAAEAARQAGVVIVAVGFGSEAGTTIDVLDKKTGVKKRVVDSEGREVVSRLDGDLLRQIALKTNGVYVPAGTGVLDLESVLQKHILPLVESSTQVKSREVRVELFQWFVGLGMLFFMGFMLLDARTNRKRQSKEKIA